jgi:hypothetical protein
MFQLNGNPISIYSEQIVNGIRYPHLRDPALREQLGVVEVADPEQYDQRFYWGVGNPKLLNDRLEVKEDGTPLYVQVYNSAREEMEDTTEQMVTKGLKSQWIAQVKQTAGSLLAQTDWMVVRKAERNVDIPATVVANRTAIVAECDRLEAAITACATVEELITVVGNQGWPNDRI